MSGITQNITNGVPFFNPDANLFFTNSATAGNLVTVNNIGGDCDGGPADTTFFDTASGGSATFINNGNTTCSEANGATTSFFGSSTAANGTLINYPNFGASGLGGTTYFNDTSTAGNAILIAYTGDGAPGRIYFYGDSTGGTSRVEVSGSDIGWGAAELNICSHNAPGVTIGSIEGEGEVSLGGNNLTVGRNNHSTIFSGFIGDSGFCSTGGSLTKIGRGTLILTGANTYTGGTTIEEGQLLVDNTTASGLGSGSVQVNAGRLGGNGTIAGSVTVGTGTGAGATLAPGERCDDLGTITIQGTLTFNSDSRYNCGLKPRQHAVVDKVVANGVTINGGKFVIAAHGSSALRGGTVLTVINNTAATPIAGSFDNLADGSIFTIGNNTYQVSYEGNDGHDLTLTVQ